MKQFKRGQVYNRPGLFGPDFEVRCMDRTRTTATFAQVGYEDDDDHMTLAIGHDGNTEVCVCWDYRGHHGYIRASSEY